MVHGDRGEGGGKKKEKKKKKSLDAHLSVVHVLCNTRFVQSLQVEPQQKKQWPLMSLATPPGPYRPTATFPDPRPQPVSKSSSAPTTAQPPLQPR